MMNISEPQLSFCPHEELTHDGNTMNPLPVDFYVTLDVLTRYYNI